jgi:type I restriction enzyme S subunit
MVNEAWREFTFEELIKDGVLEIGDGYRAKNSELGGTGPIFLRAGHVRDTHIDFDGADRFRKELAHVVVSKMSRTGDVAVTTKGNSTGRVAYISDDLPPFVYSPHLSYWRSLNEGVIFPGFLRYWSRSHQFRSQLSGFAASTDMAPYLSLIDQRHLRILLPTPSEQRAISYILGSLDDKIDLNRRMSETLEGMARTLFKSWFVDFDPVRAKFEGRGTALLEPLADLFPDSYQTSELGKIPTGWHVTTLGELSQKPQYGFTSSAIAGRVGPRFLRITDINKLPWIEWASVPYCRISEEELTQYRVRPGDILIARMADPGHGVMVDEEDIEAVFASYLIRFRLKNFIYARLVQYWLRSDGYWELVNARHAGTTRASLNAQVLSAFQLIVPPPAIADAFQKKISALRSKVNANVVESQTLSELRDTLLPKLISGELHTPDVERVLGGSK